MFICFDKKGCIIHSYFSIGTSSEPPAPPGLLVLGGQSPTGPLTSVETFGFENCIVPPLPEPRYGFGSFITPTEVPQLAVCGGWWMGKPNSTDCLTLNVTSGQWERGTFSNGPLEDSVRGVVHIENKGVFLVHRNGISFLAQDSDFWVAGNLFSQPAVCGCNVSSTSFVTIHMTDSQNILGYSVTGSEAKQEPIDTWPSRMTKCHGPGCGATQYHLIVAGGVSGWDEVLNSVEIVNIGNKGLRRGGNLKQARAYFQMIPVGSTYSRILAIGGQGVHSMSASSEWWDSEENSWEDGPSLSTERSIFSTLMAWPDLVCSKIDPPLHSCPSLSDTGQTCIFSSAMPGNYDKEHIIFLLD